MKKNLYVLLTFLLVLICSPLADASGSRSVNINETITLYVDHVGQGAVVPSSVSWSSSDSRIIKIVNANGLNCTVMGVNDTYGTSATITASYAYNLAGSTFRSSDRTTVTLSNSSGSSGSSGSYSSSGKCGSNLRWYFSNDNDHLNDLYIEGTGAMNDYAMGGPWNSHYIVNVYIGNGVTSIGEGAFYNLSFKSITLPDSLTSIGASAFYNCIPLGSGEANIIIPDNVTSIGKKAFQNSRFNYIVVPDLISNIGQDAFAVSTGTVIATKDSPASIAISKAGNNFTDPDTGFKLKYVFNGTLISGLCLNGVPTGNEFILPDDITELGYNVFKNKSSLENLILPAKLKKIKDQAFYGCTGLTEIIIPETVESIGDSAFAGCSGLREFILPDAITALGAYAFQNCSSLVEIELSNGLTNVPNYCFQGCTSLLTVKFPAYLESVGTYAFNNCTAIKTVSFPRTLKTIKQYAFYACTKLERVFLPYGFNTLGVSAFNGCISLEEVSLSEAVSSIGNNAFNNCVSLVLTVENGSAAHLYAIENEIPFIIKESVEIHEANSVLPVTLTVIMEDAFRGTDLEYVRIPDGVQEIKTGAFADCMNLKQIYIPASVTIIDANAFMRSDYVILAGIHGSTVEQYAAENAFQFVAVE